MDSSVVSARLIGSIFVEKGLITEEQLEVALEQQRATGVRLGEILVEKFNVERLDLASALAEQWAEYERQGQAEERDALIEAGGAAPDPAEERALPAIPTPSVKRPIGEIFIERGLVTDEQLEEALERQRASGVRLGEILVASGRLSRLELASALADQWATFQKLRPPAEAPLDETPADDDHVILPTPEVVAPAPPPAFTQAAAAELTGRVDALATRIDHVSAERLDWKPQVEKTAELLRARIEHLEEQILSRSTDEAAQDDLRSELGALAARIDTIPAPSDEWRHELAQVADNLRIRIERVEQVPVGEQLADLRALLDGLTERLDSLPAPVEGWREPVADLTRRIDGLSAPSEEWREPIADLQASVAEIGADVARNAGGGDELRASVEALAARVESMPAPSDEWRERVADLSGRIDAMEHRSPEDWGARIADLAAHVEALPTDAWRPELAEVAENLRTRLERLEQAPPQAGAAPEELQELRASLASLHERLDALPTDAWRPELAEVAENLRTRLERLEQAPPQPAAAPEELQELRASLASLHERLDALPTDAWRPELAEVAENLHTRLERLEQAPSPAVAAPEELQQLRSSLSALHERVESLPVPTDEWRDAVDGLGARLAAIPTDAWRPELAQVAENLHTRLERLEQAPSPAVAAPEELQELRASLSALHERVESQPPPSSEEWREQVADLVARVDALPVDSWRPELGAVAENLHEHVERVEHALRRAPSADDIHEIRAALDVLAERVESVPARSEEWRAPVAGLEARIEELAHGMSEDARAASVTEIAGQLAELGHKVAAAEALATDVRRLSGRIDALPLPSEEWRAQIAELAQAVGIRVDHLEQRLASTVHDEALGGVVSRIDELSSRLEDTSALDDVLHRLASVAAVAGRVDDVEQRLAHEAAAAAGIVPALDELRQRAAQDHARLERLTELVTQLAQRRDASVVERELAGRLSSLDGAIGALPATLDERIAAAESRVADESHRAVAEVESLRRQVDDLRAMLSAAGEGSAHAVAELRSAIEKHGARVKEVQAAQSAFERHTEEMAAGRKADVSALRARLETIEASVAAATAWQEPVGAANERVDRLEALMIETSTSEAVERNTEIEGLRLALSERIASLESTQLKRKDLKELRDGIARVDARLDERNAEDDASNRAVEEAVREGLAVLGEQLAAAEATYLDAGRALSGSIHGLGLAIAGADTHLSGVDPAATSALQETSYVAFAPTAEGYRLIVCDGRTPDLGGRVELSELEGTLVVTRVGASPLPFDVRRCVYLEHA